MFASIEIFQLFQIYKLTCCRESGVSLIALLFAQFVSGVSCCLILYNVYIIYMHYSTLYILALCYTNYRYITIHPFDNDIISLHASGYTIIGHMHR